MSAISQMFRTSEKAPLLLDINEKGDYGRGQHVAGGCGDFLSLARNSGLFLACSVDSTGVKFFMQIMVRDNNVDQALRALKKKLQREGVYREMKLRRHFEKPSEKRAREKAAAVRRARKMERKQQERDGAKA